jgi:hypothetical protein
MSQSLVHRRKVFLDNSLTALTVSLFDSFLDLGDGFVARQDAGDCKEDRKSVV